MESGRAMGTALARKFRPAAAEEAEAVTVSPA